MTINTIILYKFGWVERSFFWNKPFTITDLQHKDIKYDFFDKFFIIQNPDTMAYFFVIVKDEDIVKKEVELTKCEMFLIKTNQELFKLIIKYEAFSENYQRHFRINKILKQ
jgi:hypothetical protein